jgi:hypothetical protein
MNRIVAVKLKTELGRGNIPDAAEWSQCHPAIFSSDWSGKNEDPRRETQARLLWSDKYLFIQFRCRYREIYVFEDANQRHDGLWQRDVAEVFIQPDLSDPKHYREFEISPNGDWLDLDICTGEKSILNCDLKSRVTIDQERCIWTAEMAIPMDCFTPTFSPGESWKLNLFRIEGPEPRRFYSAWQPTHTSKPNFHVPECFAELHFSG